MACRNAKEADIPRPGNVSPEFTLAPGRFACYYLLFTRCAQAEARAWLFLTPRSEP